LICDDIEVVLRSELQSTVIQRSSSLSTTTTNQANPQAIKTPIAIYPNPAKDQLTLQYVPNAAATVSILLASGQIMSTQQLAIGTARHAIDLQDLPEGLYLLKIEESQQVPTTKRFIKIR